MLVTAAPESPRTWCAEVWNTWTGEVTGGFTVRQKGPVMILDIPAFTRDMAVKLTFHGGPELQSVTEDMRGLRQAEPVHDRGAGTWGSVHGPFR